MSCSTPSVAVPPRFCPTARSANEIKAMAATATVHQRLRAAEAMIRPPTKRFLPRRLHAAAVVNHSLVARSLGKPIAWRPDHQRKTARDPVAAIARSLSGAALDRHRRRLPREDEDPRAVAPFAAPERIFRLHL